MNYTDAMKQAQNLSFLTPDRKYYINWMEDWEYCIDSEPEFDGQGYYLGGVYYYEREDYDNNN